MLYLYNYLFAFRSKSLKLSRYKDRMNYAKIIRESWQLTVDNPKIKWLILVPTFMAVFIFALKVAWQGFMYASRLGYIEQGFDINTVGEAAAFLSSNGLWDWGIVLVLITLIFMFVIPAWIDSTLILCVNHKIKNPDKYLSIKQKMLQAFGFYFRMFELNAVLSIFSLISIALFTATVFRFFNSSLLAILGVGIAIYAVISLVINTLFSFAHYFMVCDDEGLGDSLKKSASLVFLNLMPTIGVLLIMFLINFRVVVNIMVVLGVPVGIFTAIALFNNSAITAIAIILGIFLFGLAAYITSITTVFSTAMWIKALDELKRRQSLLEEGTGPTENEVLVKTEARPLDTRALD